MLIVPGMEGFEFEYKGEMLVTDTIFGRWDFVVASDTAIRNGSGNNIAVRRIYCADLKTYQHRKYVQSEKLKFICSSFRNR